MSTSVDTMKNFVNVLKLYANDTTTNGVAILDHAIRTTTRFAGLQDAVNHFVADMAYVTATQGAAQSLYQNCGIVVGAANDFTVDTGAVTGYNAGMGTIKNAQTIIPEPEGVLLSQTELPAAGSQTVHSYTGADGNTFYFTITYPETYLTVRDNSTAPPDINGNPDSTYAESTLLQEGETYFTKPNEQGDYNYASTEQVLSAIATIMRGVENYWATEGFKLAYDSFGLDFNNRNINLIFGINQLSQAETGPAASDVAGLAYLPASNIDMEINSVMYAGIDPNDVNGNTRLSGSGQNYLDRTIAHEFIHAVMQASGTLKDGMPEFFTEGIAELVHGDDDFDSNYSDEVVALALDSARLQQALVFKAGTGTNDAYPAGDMFLRYICHQSLPTQIVSGDGVTPGLFGYTGGEEILSGVASGSQINVSTDVQLVGANMAGDDLFVASNAGVFIVRDARGKLINFAGADSNVTARFCAANAEGKLDGRGLSGYEILQGADYATNEIYAGDGGSQLWGGSYSSDDLHGGGGVDTFIAGVGCGYDNIFGAFTEDTINLAATTLDQITNVNVISNIGGECDILMNFSDGSALMVWSSSSQTTNFKLADGSAYSHNNATDTWTKTS